MKKTTKNMILSAATIATISGAIVARNVYASRLARKVKFCDKTAAGQTEAKRVMASPFMTNAVLVDIAINGECREPRKAAAEHLDDLVSLKKVAKNSKCKDGRDIAIKKMAGMISEIDNSRGGIEALVMVRELSKNDEDQEAAQRRLNTLVKYEKRTLTKKNRKTEVTEEIDFNPDTTMYASIYSPDAKWRIAILKLLDDDPERLKVVLRDSEYKDVRQLAQSRLEELNEEVPYRDPTRDISRFSGCKDSNTGEGKTSKPWWQFW